MGRNRWRRPSKRTGERRRREDMATRDGGTGTAIRRGRDAQKEVVRDATGLIGMIGRGGDRGTGLTTENDDEGDRIRGHGRETEMAIGSEDEDDHLPGLDQEKGILRDALDTGADHLVVIAKSGGGRPTIFMIPQ